MSDKDPVREDLRIALDKWLQDHPGRSLAAGYLADGYLAGHGDGWNRCLDEVINMIAVRQDGVYGDSEYSELDRLKQDLEKLRR